MLMNEALSVGQQETVNCTARKGDAENALFNDEEETDNVVVDVINSNSQCNCINNNKNEKEEFSVEDSDASTLYSNWSDSCSTLESDTNVENEIIRSTAVEVDATSSAMHKWEFYYNPDNSKTDAFMSQTKIETEHIMEDKCKVTLPMCLHLNLSNIENGMEGEQTNNCLDVNKRFIVSNHITHMIELHCTVPSSLHTSHLTSHSQCTNTETRQHRLCISLHIDRALILSIITSLPCEEGIVLQIRKSAQRISRSEHLTLVCYYVNRQMQSHNICGNLQCNKIEFNGAVIRSDDENKDDKSTDHEKCNWQLNAYDVIAHNTNCTCNGITLLPEYRYHIKVEQISEQEKGLANVNTTTCARPLLIALNKFCSLEFFDNCKVNCTVENNVEQTRTICKEKQENNGKNSSESRVTKMAILGTRNCKRVRKTDATVCETTPREKVSQRKKENTLIAPSPICRKRSTICENIVKSTSNSIKTMKNKCNGMTPLACDANEVLLTEEDSIVIYTTNIRLSFREMQRCASQHIVLNPPYQYASRALILVAEPPIIRSVKLLSVIPFITHIVRQSWLKELLKKSMSSSDKEYKKMMYSEAVLHKHVYMEKRTILSIEGVNDFSIASLLRVRPENRQCLLNSFCFWVHPNAKPQEQPLNDLKSVITASGGELAFDSSNNNISEVNIANSSNKGEQMMQMSNTNVNFIFVMPSLNVSRTSWRIFWNALHTMHQHQQQQEQLHQGNHIKHNAQVIALKRLSSALFITPDDLFKCVLQQKRPVASTVRNIPFDVQCAMRHANAL